MLTDQEREMYLEQWNKRARRERKEIAQQQQQAMELADQCAMELQDRFNVLQVYLFGSLARGDGFHKNTDLDLAIEGLDPEAYWDAYRLCVDPQLTDSYPLDLVRLETASDSLKSRIKRLGRPLL